MFYSAEDFIVDFLGIVLSSAEYVGLNPRLADEAEFRKARLSCLKFADNDAVPADQARRIFWASLEDFLAKERGRRFAGGTTSRTLALPANMKKRIDVFLPALFTRLQRIE